LSKSHRASIFLEDAEVLEQVVYPGDQHVLKIRAPRLAAAATPGAFAHLQCSGTLRQRRPMSVMLTDPEAGWVQFLYKAVGLGSGALAKRGPGERLSVLGPIGNGFVLDSERRRPLLLGGGVGIPPMIFAASELRAHHPDTAPIVLMGSEVPFPFDARPSEIMVSGIPDGVIAAMPLMDDWGIASRLASLRGYAGCYEGYITDLARHWLNALSVEERREVYILSCGPTPMLKATAALATEYAVPVQVSLEEYMACAVGGCAGCTVRVNESGKFAMRRVCVDGPVFDGSIVQWQ